MLGKFGCKRVERLLAAGDIFQFDFAQRRCFVSVPQRALIERQLAYGIALLQQNAEKWGASNIVSDDNVTKVSIVGAGMETHPGVAAEMFEALFSRNVNIQMISTSEIKVSVLVDERDADRAVQAVHDKFFSEFGGNN